MTKSIKRWIAIGVVVAAVAVGLLSLVTGGGMTPYVGFNEARAAKSSVQVMGEVIKGASSYDPQSGSFSFFITDAKSDRMKVVYDGTKPGNFDQATSVVCIGRWNGDSFHAERLLVKCPSKYQNLPKNQGT